MVEEATAFGGGPDDRLRTLRRRMWFWGTIAVLGQAAALYALFGQFLPAAREYKQLKGQLTIQVIHKDGSLGETRQFKNLIVNAGETYLRDAFNNETAGAEAMDFDFHGIGTGATAAAETDTACQTELTTQYNPDNTRATGTSSAPSANVWRTVGTNTVDATAAITEWCLLNQAATGGGTMWSRVVFSTINLASADSLQTTYDLTIESMLTWWWLGSMLCVLYLCLVEIRRRRPAGAVRAVCVGLILLLLASPALATHRSLVADAPQTNADGTNLADLSGYRFYNCPTSPCSKANGTQIGTVAAPSPDPAAGAIVTFVLPDTVSGFAFATAFDLSGNESAASNVVAIDTLGPGVPGNLRFQ